jgi:hypothetical protein
MRYAGHIARFVGMINDYKVAVEEPRRLIPFEKYMRTWDDNIKTGHSAQHVDRILLEQDRFQ